MPDKPNELAAAGGGAPQAAALFLIAESPVHAGAGGAEAALDLPIQRSVQTRWPIINDSTLRGGLKRMLENEQDASDLFGSEAGETPHPGRFSTPDAEVALFPVASAVGLTAWVTCLEALQYLVRRLKIFESKMPDAADKIKELHDVLATAQTGPGVGEAWVAAQCDVKLKDSVVLESDRFSIPQGSSAEKLADWFCKYAVPLPDPWPARVKSHFVLIHEEAFTHYAERKTDVRTRVKIENGRAAASGPWTEENLPVDTLLYSVLSESRKEDAGKLKDFLDKVGIDRNPVVQLGGDQNLGRGILRLKKL